MHILLLILFSLNISYAQRVSIDIDDNEFRKAPARDLIYNNNPIDPKDLVELSKGGFDISTLNPRQSHLWQDVKRSADNYHELNYPSAESVFVFQSERNSPSEIYRAQVKIQSGEFFVITASLNNHTNIIRASLLRMLGYDIDTPKIYKKLKINFDSSIQKEQFLERLGERTLTNRRRWVEAEEESSLVLKDITLEPAELRNVNIFLPVMSRDRQAERRSFRALLNIYLLTDFPQAINAISWSIGRVFNNTIIFNHPYGANFSNVTLEDLKWIHRKLITFSREDIVRAVQLAGYPYDIEKLIIEKILSRINSLSKLYKLNADFDINQDLTYGNISKGKLIKGDYENYVVDFYNEDVESPYSLGQLLRLLRSQSIYSGLSGLLDVAVRKLLPGQSMEDAIMNVQDKIRDHRQNNSSESILPLKFFSSPIANGRVYAQRNVIFGDYLGSNAAIQLVDNMGVEANLGIYSNLTGLPQNITPGLSAQVSVARNYIHIRPVSDLQSASKESIKKVLVPRHMKKLGRIIKQRLDCSVPEGVYTEEQEVNGVNITFINYDESLSSAREQAIAIRLELEQSGHEGPFFIQAINREDLCLNEENQNRDKNIKEFLDEFALNETFMINDVLRVSSNSNIPLPIGASGVTVGLGSEHSVALLRSMLLRKRADGFEVTFQTQRDKRNGISERLSFFAELLNNNTQWTKGEMLSNVYKIKLENISEEEKVNALESLRALLVNNNDEVLKKHYKSVDLDHQAKVRLNTFRFLFRKSEKLDLHHEVEIQIPNRPGANHSINDRTRRIYSTSHYRRKGNDFRGAVDRILSSISGFLRLGQNNQDPGRTTFGTSYKENYITEGELTENRELNPSSKVELQWTGWNRKPKHLEKVFSKIESYFDIFTDSNTIDNSIIHGTRRVRSYDIRTSIIIYPQAINDIQERLFHKNEMASLNYLYYLYGRDEWQSYCKRAADFFGDNGPQVYITEDRRFIDCVPQNVKEILMLRKKKMSTDRVEKLHTINKIIKMMFKDFNITRSLEFIGVKNFFATTRITGFRENHHQGYLDYISNSVGSYNTNYGTGIYDMLASQLNISQFELRALMYTPGMGM